MRRRRGDPWAAARASALARGARIDARRVVMRSRRISETERRYAIEVLEPARRRGQVLRYQHQPRPPIDLAYRCTFTPDYRVEYADGSVEIVDVKGAHVWEDATIKLKFAARLHPDVRCVQAQWKRGRWWRRVVPPR